MSTITPGVVIPVSGSNGSISGSNFNTTPSYSGTFIPTIWSGKLNAKFYSASTFADICNRNWEGDISNIGDKVIINNIPSISIADYTVGSELTYQTPTPDTIEMVVNRAKSFAFQVSDVLDFQSKPDLMDMFSNDASEQMRTVIDSTCLLRTMTSTPTAGGKEDGVVAANRGATAGAKSGAYNLGIDSAPVDLSTANNALNLILSLASVLDEQNIPESERFLIIDPTTRYRLMQSNLAQAQFMGDDKSMIRNGMIGKIDRFTVYVSNQLPRSGGAFYLSSGDGTEQQTATANTYTLTGTPVALAGGVKRRLIVAGHKSAIAFASQMTKTEQLRNPKDFGDLVRGLNIFGHQVVKGSALATALVAN